MKVSFNKIEFWSLFEKLITSTLSKSSGWNFILKRVFYPKCIENESSLIL